VVSVSQLAAGPCSSPLSRVHPHHKVLSAPSSVCRRLCKAADFFQYAVHGTVAEGGGKLRRRWPAPPAFMRVACTGVLVREAFHVM
jgi:hypothetical protein